MPWKIITETGADGLHSRSWRALYGSDSGNFVRELAGQAIRHHAAIGNAGGIDALGINRVVLLEPGDQRAKERHVVHIVLHGVGAAGSGVHVGIP